MKKQILILLLISILVFTTGCHAIITDVEKGENNVDEVNPTVNPVDKDQNEKTEREPNKKIEVKVEGDTELRDAKLMYSDDNSYSLYVLENFTFSSEELNKHILFSNYDEEFFVKIEKLDSNADIDELKESFTNAYSGKGSVITRDPATIFTDEFKDSKLWLHVSILKSDKVNVLTSINYLIKEYNGKLYSFTLNFPTKEAAEGITPSLWSMLTTMEVE